MFVEVELADVVWKLVAGDPVGIDDLAVFDPDVANVLKTVDKVCCPLWWGQVPWVHD